MTVTEIVALIIATLLFSYLYYLLLRSCRNFLKRCERKLEQMEESYENLKQQNKNLEETRR